MTDIGYRELGRMIQINRDFAEVDQSQLEKLRGEPLNKHVWTREEGIQLFNDTAMRIGLHPLKDPKGYMYLEDNIQNYIKDRYAETYEAAYDAIEAGQMYGTTYAVDAVLDKLDGTVRRDVSKGLPKGVLYSELKYTPITPEVKQWVEPFVRNRLAVTLTHSVSRSFEAGTKELRIQQFEQSQQALGEQLALAIKGGKEQVATWEM